MRLIRAAGQNVSPSDDGRLYDQIFSDGLFTDTAFAALGTNNVQVGAMYGDLCGRDFTIEQQTIAVPLPEGDGETTGYIYVEIDTSAETPLSVGASLSPFTPTYEDINVNGAVAQMIVAEYTASAVAVTLVTATYTRAAAGAVRPGSIATVESSPVTTNHAVGDFILYGGTVYRVTAAIATGETIVPGTNVIAESIGDTLTALNNGLLQYEIQTGYVTVNDVTNTQKTVHTNFPNQFTKIPTVVVSLGIEGSYNRRIHLGTITETGFDVGVALLSPGSSANLSFHWIAIAVN